jgi:hypothetical protein
MAVLLDHDRDHELDVPEGDELEALAMAADPDAELAADAVPWTGGDVERADLLPDWYMPAPVAGARSPWQRVMGLAFVGALVLINVSGLCVTYGVVELA